MSRWGAIKSSYRYRLSQGGWVLVCSERIFGTNMGYYWLTGGYVHFLVCDKNKSNLIITRETKQQNISNYYTDTRAVELVDNKLEIKRTLLRWPLHSFSCGTFVMISTRKLTIWCAMKFKYENFDTKYAHTVILTTLVSFKLLPFAKIFANLIFFSPLELIISQWRNGERPGRALLSNHVQVVLIIIYLII